MVNSNKTFSVELLLENQASLVETLLETNLSELNFTLNSPVGKCMFGY